MYGSFAVNMKLLTEEGSPHLQAASALQAQVKSNIYIADRISRNQIRASRLSKNTKSELRAFVTLPENPLRGPSGHRELFSTSQCTSLVCPSSGLPFMTILRARTLVPLRTLGNW